MEALGSFTRRGALALLVLHPVSFGALWSGAEPLPIAAVALVESILVGLPASVALPYSEAPAPAAREPAGVDWRHDGFSVRWLARPHASLEDPAGPAFMLGLAAGLGAVVWVPVALTMGELGLEISGFAFLAIGGVLGGALGVAQFVACWIQRALVNAWRARAWVDVSLLGRTLTVNARAWQRSADDVATVVESGLVLSRGEDRLTIRGGPVELRWLRDQLDRTRPDRDDGAVPVALQQLRE